MPKLENKLILHIHGSRLGLIYFLWFLPCSQDFQSWKGLRDTLQISVYNMYGNISLIEILDLSTLTPPRSSIVRQPLLDLEFFAPLHRNVCFILNSPLIVTCSDSSYEPVPFIHLKPQELRTHFLLIILSRNVTKPQQKN